MLSQHFVYPEHLHDDFIDCPLDEHTEKVPLLTADNLYTFSYLKNGNHTQI